VVESKADDKFPVVSAASIAAKVVRDKELKDWAFKENFPEGQKPDSNWGCGYPSDPLAKAWIRRNFDPVFGFP